MIFLAYVAVTLLAGGLVFVTRKSKLANVALLFCALCFGLTSLEGYYRFIYAESSGVGRLGGENFWDRYYQFDRYGLRASNLPLSKTKPNVVVLGDSLVFGAGLKTPAERYSDRLEASHPQWHVVNLALPGWETTDEIGQLEKFFGERDAPIALVILNYFFNDIQGDVTAQDQARVKSPTPAPPPTAVDRALQALSKYSRFIELFYYRIGYPRLVSDRLGQIELFYEDPALRARHFQTLERLRALVEKKFGAHLLVLVQPLLHSDALLDQTKFYQRFTRDLQERGFVCIDMQPIFQPYRVKKLWAHRFDPHPNAFANKLVADEISRYLATHPEMLAPLTR